MTFFESLLIQVMGLVDVKRTAEHELTLEWDSNASSDMIADSTLALITGIDKSPASVKREFGTRIPCDDADPSVYSDQPTLLARASACRLQKRVVIHADTIPCRVPRKSFRRSGTAHAGRNQ